MSQFFAIDGIQTSHRVIAPFLFRFASLLRVSGIVSGEFEENILEAEAYAFQLKKRPALLDDSRRNRAANILALGSLDRSQNVAIHWSRFSLYAAGARNLCEQFTQRLLGCLHFRPNALAALQLRGEVL